MDVAGTVQPEQWSMVVLFDGETGIILHTHQSVTTSDGEHPSELELEAEARTHAGPESGRASVLHVDPRTLDAQAHYRVDTAAGRLVEVRRERAE